MTPSRPLSGLDPPRYAWFKVALFGLLVCDTVIYATSGTLAEALDSIAWLVLLVLYELETGFGLGAQGWRTAVVRGGRLLAAAAVVAAAAGYVREREWLDAINAGLWIGLVVMFECQVLFPGAAELRRVEIKRGATVLYAGLGALIAVWIWQREWFDAYDALLWLAALVIIEMNILQALGRNRPR